MREFDPVGILREAAEAALHSEDVGYLLFDRAPGIPRGLHGLERENLIDKDLE